MLDAYYYYYYYYYHHHHHHHHYYTELRHKIQRKLAEMVL